MINPKNNKTYFPGDRVDILKCLIGDNLKSIFKIMMWDEDKERSFRAIKDEELFSFGLGIVFLEFERFGFLGFNVSGKDRSLVLWRHDKELFVINQKLIKAYGGYRTIYIDDKINSQDHLKRLKLGVISSIDIIKVSNDGRTNREFNNERGVCFNTVSGSSVVISYMLDSIRSSDLHVITPEQIEKDKYSIVTFSI